MKKQLYILASIVIVISALADNSFANRRRFSYTYESPVLPKGAKELELWNTLRLNKDKWYRRLDNRVEYEVGLGGNFQTALYLNTTTSASFDGTAIVPEGTEFGISNEWKWKALDRVADPIGLGLYAEGGLSHDEIELEGKLLLDKQFGDLLVAFNIVGEQEFESEAEDGAVETETETKLEFDLGVSYALSPEFSIGLEARHHSVMLEEDEKDMTFSALFAGPTFAYSTEGWWAVLSFMPQVTGSSADLDTKVDVVEHEKFEARLLMSFEL
jgi:hypothetical protein